MRKKGVIAVSLAAILALSSAFSSLAGWEDNKDGDYSVTVYRDEVTGQLITGWRELPWKDSSAWFYFGDDNILYQMQETPDGYIVDIDGAWYDGVKPYEWYNWGIKETPKFVYENESNILVIKMHFVSKFFPDFSGEMTLEEFKQYVENKGAKVLTCSQSSTKGKPYMIEGTIFNPTYYKTDFTFTYKNLKFAIHTQDFTDKIGTGAQISAIGVAE